MLHVPGRLQSPAETRSSRRPAFRSSARDAVCLEERFYCCGNFHYMRLDRKMSRFEELLFCVGDVFAIRLSARRNKEGVVLAPDGKQGRPHLAKILLKFRIELDVRRIVQKQIELNLYISRALQQSGVQCVG